MHAGTDMRVPAFAFTKVGHHGCELKPSLMRLSVMTMHVTLEQSVKQFQEQMCLHIHVSRFLSVSVI